MKRALEITLLAATVAVAMALWAVRTGRVPTEYVPEALRALAPQAAAEPPPPSAGTPFVLELTEPPTDRYGRPPARDADATYRPVVEATGAGYDPTMGQAAAELAAFYADHHALAPSEPLAFILDAAGATVWGVRQAVVVTNAEGLAAVSDAVVEAVGATGGQVVAGVGEVVLLDAPPRRVIAVLTAHPGPSIEPMPRGYQAGDRVRIRGTLPPEHAHPTVLAMQPDGTLFELDCALEDRRFTTSFDATAGRWQVELLATGPHGPTPLAQLTFHVDEPIPDALNTHWPPDETMLDDPAAELARLVDNDRAADGLPPFRRDPALDVVAQRHSVDMARNAFVGHVSPRTGSVTDRLRVARYRSAGHGENVALNRNLWDAEQGLMRSLGHRRNILSTDLDSAGFGAVHKDDGWYVTQVFARPAPVIDDLERARGALLERLSEAREAARVSPLRVFRPLDAAARGAAGRPSAKPNEALDDAAAHGGLDGQGSGYVVQLATLEQFAPPAGLLDGRFRRVGLGVGQFIGGVGPDIQVVVLVAE